MKGDNNEQNEKMLLMSVIFLATSPLESALILVWMATSWWGMIFSLAAAFLIARFIEYLRMKRFSDINAAVFILCAYAPGIIASFIFCSILLNMPKSPEDLNGWGALARGVIGIIVFISQLVLTIMGLIITLNAPKKSGLPQTYYSPDAPDPDTFFNDDKKV